MSVAISRDAPDLSYLDLLSARFAVNGAKLVIGGADTAYVGNGTADFTVDSIGLYDFLQFVGVYQRFGQSFEFGSVVVFPLGTFQFSELMEALPQFPSTTNPTRSAYGGPSPYAEIVAAGVPILVSAEPSSAAMLILGGVTVLVAGRSTRRYATRPRRASGFNWRFRLVNGDSFTMDRTAGVQIATF